MLLLLPLVGGVLAGWLAPRPAAIALQAAFAVIAATVVALSAPMHGSDYGIVVGSFRSRSPCRWSPWVPGCYFVADASPREGSRTHRRTRSDAGDWLLGARRRVAPGVLAVQRQRPVFRRTPRPRWSWPGRPASPSLSLCSPSA